MSKVPRLATVLIKDIAENGSAQDGSLWPRFELSVDTSFSYPDYSSVQ